MSFDEIELAIYTLIDRANLVKYALQRPMNQSAPGHVQ